MSDLTERLRRNADRMGLIDGINLAHEAADALEAAEAEIARHHKDFERWEAMADKGAQQIARIAAIDVLQLKWSRYLISSEDFGNQVYCILHPEEDNT